MNTRLRHTIETALATLLLPLIGFGLIPRRLLRGEGRRPRAGWGGAPAAAGLAAGLGLIGYVSAAFVRRGRGTPIPLDPPQAFVATGLFQYMRNPMYSGVALVLLSEALLFRSRRLLVYAAAVIAGLHANLIWFEEPQLARRFGDAYCAYCAAVPRWLPRR